MNPDVPDELLSCGSYLQTLRLKQHIRLETVAQQTRITLAMLRCIEAEAFEKLPSNAILRGFVRSYARCIGACEHTALEKLERRRREYERERIRLNNRVRNSFWPRLTLVLVMLFGIIGIGIYVLGPADQTFPAPNSPASPQEQTASTDIPQPDRANSPPSEYRNQNRLPGITHADAAEKASDLASGEAVQHSGAGKPAAGELRLEIHARKDTWLKIIMDTHAPQTYDFSSGDTLILSATSSYNLLIGDATALSLILNGKPVTVVGRSGQTVNVWLP